MNFIFTDDGYIPYHKISKIESRKGGGSNVYYEFENEFLLTRGIGVDDCFGTPVPAQPGFFKIGILEDGSISKEPIVAWMVDESLAIAVTLQTGCSNINDLLIPDGRVFALEDQEWSSEESYRLHIIAARKKKAKKKGKK